MYIYASYISTVSARLPEPVFALLRMHVSYMLFLCTYSFTKCLLCLHISGACMHQGPACTFPSPAHLKGKNDYLQEKKVGLYS